MRAFIAHYVPLAGSVRQQHREDAGTAAYASSLLGLDALKQAVTHLLTDGHPDPAKARTRPALDD
jgi:hypothetical protein